MSACLHSILLRYVHTLPEAYHYLVCLKHTQEQISGGHSSPTHSPPHISTISRFIRPLSNRPRPNKPTFIKPLRSPKNATQYNKGEEHGAWLTQGLIRGSSSCTIQTMNNNFFIFVKQIFAHSLIFFRPFTNSSIATPDGRSIVQE